MNSNTQSVFRIAVIAFSFFFFKISFAGSFGDVAAQRLSHCGSVAVQTVGSDVRMGVSKAVVAQSLGAPGRVLNDGRWIYFGDYWVDNSAAHGSLVIRYSDGKVDELTIVTPWDGVALCRGGQGSSNSELIARK